MDSTRVVVKSYSDFIGVIEHCGAEIWIFMGATLVFVTVLISLTVLVCKWISCCHEYKMFMAARPRIIVKKFYFRKKCKRASGIVTSPNGQLTPNNSSNNHNGVIVINNSAVASNVQSDCANLTTSSMDDSQAYNTDSIKDSSK